MSIDEMIIELEKVLDGLKRLRDFWYDKEN